MVTCLHCGEENREGAKFCRACGKSLTVEEPSQETTPESPAATPEAPTAPAEQPSAEVSHETGTGHGARDTGHAEEPIPPLPEGALLNGRRYEITAVLCEGGLVNEYEAVGTDEKLKCACGKLNEVGENFCSECGQSLEGVQAIQPAFRIKEIAHERLFETDKVVQESVPALFPALIDSFSYAPYGERHRFYLVRERLTGTPLKEIQMPPLENVLQWGAQLAEALAALHGKGFVLPKLADTLVLTETQVLKLTDGSAVEKVGAEETASKQADDVKHLAELLCGWLKEGADVPPPAKEALQQALSDDALQRPSAAVLCDAIKQALEFLRAPKAVSLRCAKGSHVGMMRELNEDSVLTAEFSLILQSHEIPFGLYVVADGMGGHESGEVASKLALQVVGEKVLSRLAAMLKADEDFAAFDFTALLKESFEEANRVVHEQAQKARSNMGTTLTGAIVVGAKAFIANVGDSRTYLIRNGQTHFATKDHSLVQAFVDIGQITAEEARYHPQRHVITRSIGTNPEVEVDTYEQTLSPGDILLVCSDGLCDMIEDEDIIGVLLQHPDDPQAACCELIRLANEAGGHDNISVIIVSTEAVQ